MEKYVRGVPLDVTSNESVATDAKTVSQKTKELTALINYHVIAFNGPIEYMPIKMYQCQHEVNYIGNIRMTQNFLSLLKSTSSSKGARKRIIFTGTSGGPCIPCPPLLSAYMSSKFSCEAMVQCLRMEISVMDHDVDICVINP